jgi:hypothetical protein
LQNWLLNKSDNAYLPSVIETPITTLDKGGVVFTLSWLKARGRQKQGCFGLTFSILLLFIKAKCLQYLGQMDCLVMF